MPFGGAHARRRGWAHAPTRTTVHAPSSHLTTSIVPFIVAGWIVHS